MGAGGDGPAAPYMISGLRVDYSPAMLSGFSAGHPADGDLVVARGSVFDALGVKLTAGSRHPAETDLREREDGEHAEREGLITRDACATDLDVDDLHVTKTADTHFV